ncbi:unnamed protein product [Rotaria magnacalcarata]|uniref:Uncharacterized protein n=2 Tax=Rotaria magnacalcarata TaxID=392030 RepID=A0A815NLU5_9BILA|nr:unnamed protein product [Rotaria magnacalcarata]
MFFLLVYIPANAKWKQNGVTVAGGHGQGDATNQLYLPYSLFVDDNQTVVIADCANHRIIQWKNGDTTNGQVVAGGKGQGNRLNQLEGKGHFVSPRFYDLPVNECAYDLLT